MISVLGKKIFKRYAKSTIFAGVPIVFGSAMSLITLPIILRNLPIKDYGVLQLALAFQAWVLMFTGARISSGMIRGITKGAIGTFIYILIKRLKISLIISIVSFLVSLIFFYVWNNDLLIILFWLSLLNLVFGIVTQNTFLNYFIAKKQIKDWSFWQVLITFVVMTGATFVAFYTKSIIYFFLVQVITNIFMTWIGIFLIIKKDNLIKAYKEDLIDKSAVSYGLKLIPVDVISVTANKAAHFIIGPFFGFTNLAVFSIANKLRSKSSNFIRSIIPPLFYADFTKKEKGELYKIIKHYLIRIGGFGIFLTGGFILVAWVYIVVFLPQNFQESINYFFVLALGLPAALLSIFLHTVLEAHLRYKELAVIGVLPNMTKIFLVLILGFLWGVYGICIGLALSSWVTFTFYYLMTIKKDVAIKILKKYPFLEKLAQKY